MEIKDCLDFLKRKKKETDPAVVAELVVEEKTPEQIAQEKMERLFADYWQTKDQNTQLAEKLKKQKEVIVELARKAGFNGKTFRFGTNVVRMVDKNELVVDDDKFSMDEFLGNGYDGYIKIELKENDLIKAIRNGSIDGDKFGLSVLEGEPSYTIGKN